MPPKMPANGVQNHIQMSGIPGLLRATGVEVGEAGLPVPPAQPGVRSSDPERGVYPGVTADGSSRQWARDARPLSNPKFENRSLEAGSSIFELPPANTPLEPARRRVHLGGVIPRPLQIVSNATATPVLPARPRPRQMPVPPMMPPWHVILHDDDTHSPEYVVEMMVNIFSYDEARGFKIAREVDESGRVIVATCQKELAELRVEQIHDYGADPRIKESTGPMRATMEPAE